MNRPDFNPQPAPVRLATVTPLTGRPQASPVGGRATYKVSEVAELLGISRATVYVLLNAGQIPARRIGSRWIIARRRFDDWLNASPNDDVRPTGTEVGK